MKSVSLRLCAVLLLLAAVIVGVVACQTNGGGDDETTAVDVGTISEPATEAPTEAPVDTVEEETTEEETTLKVLEWESYDPSLDNSVINPDDIHVVDPTQWVAVDGLDRVLPTNTTTGGVREDKTVAIFYWTWHGDFANSQYAYNNQKNLDILLANGLTEEDYFTKRAFALRQMGIYTSDVSSSSSYHFWDEPVFGYYDGDDEWVIRKHAEMLAAAGVDVVFFDNTNGTFTWLQTALKVMKVFSEARAQGVDAPDVSFLLPFGAVEWSGIQMVELYNEIYAKGLYEDVWYKLDGKPMLMGWPGSLDSQDATIARTIREFFTFRSGIGDYKDQTTATNYWGWLSVFPQQIYYNDQGELEQITVGTAINHNYVDKVIAPMTGENVISRTWTSKGYDTRENALYYGACFAEQWENAIAADPDVVFVTAWNEWVAMKLKHWTGDYYNCFVDQYNDLYSRDCEPSNGPMKDYYYYQLVSYIREYKGTNPIEAASEAKLIDVNGGYGQWANVGPVYNDYFGLTDRDFNGYKDPATNKPLHYTNDTGRNDIYDAKVARDYENIYFMVRTLEDLTPYTDADWMRLYISTGDSDTNWEHYEFVLNKQNPNSETEATLERFTGNGYETEVVGTVAYSVKGNVMTVCIPKTMLGIANETYDFSFDFKWVDNANEDEEGDIMTWYSNGDVAPIGRFNFCYTTTGSEPNDGTRPSYGWETLDLTDPEVQTLLAESMVGADAQGVEFSFGTDGLTITSTMSGNDTSLILDYTKAPAYITADRFDYVTVTYKTNSADMEKLRIGFGSGVDVPMAVGSRAKTIDIISDGETHTAVCNISKLRDWKGYVKEVGLFFAKDQAAGASITITSIQFHTENPDAEAAE